MLYQELENKYSVPIAEAAEILGMSPQTLQAGLKQNAFPFGVGFKGTGSSYYYYIHKGLFDKFMKSELTFNGGVLHD